MGLVQGTLFDYSRIPKSQIIAGHATGKVEPLGAPENFAWRRAV